MMTSLFSLWLPILLSAVAVFIVSSMIHMLSPWHKSDYPKMPNEDQVMDALRPFGIPPGDYMMPRPASAQDMKTPEFQAKRARGPIVIMTVIPPGPPTMAPYLVKWFVYLVLVSLLAAFVAVHAVGATPSFHREFHFVAITAFTAYAVALWQMSIWYHRPWSTTFRNTVDGLIYAVLTGVIFGWCWPK